MQTSYGAQEASWFNNEFQYKVAISEAANVYLMAHSKFEYWKNVRAVNDGNIGEHVCLIYPLTTLHPLVHIKQS